MWSLWLFVLLESRLITTLQVTSTAKQYSFADDAGKTGSTTEMKRYRDLLSTLGPDFGYFSNDKEWWIIAKPDKKESVKEVFKEADSMLLPLRHAAETCYATSPSAQNIGKLTIQEHCPTSRID